MKEYKRVLKKNYLSKKNKVPHAPTKAPGNLNKIILDDETTTILFYCACASLSRKRKKEESNVSKIIAELQMCNGNATGDRTGDILIIDADSESVKDGDIALLLLDGNRAVRRLKTY